jgi:DNA polymerase III subunit delta'
VGDLAHPDLHWYFPRPRSKDPDPEPEDVRQEYRAEAADRAKGGGLYPSPDGMDGIFIASVRAIVSGAVVTPAVGRRKVILVGDAERMVPQEGSEYAANAFLKLLEEPPADTTIILTTSEPGALLPTIRSRLVSVRVPLLPDEDVLSFVEDPQVSAALDRLDLPRGARERVELAAGAPGRLIGESGWQEALEQARTIIRGAESGRAERLRLAMGLKPANARGGFSDSLDALTFLVHQRMRRAVGEGRLPDAGLTARAMDAIERAREMAGGNVNPQLIGASLMRDLASLLR